MCVPVDSCKLPEGVICWPWTMLQHLRQACPGAQCVLPTCTALWGTLQTEADDSLSLDEAEDGCMCTSPQKVQVLEVQHAQGTGRQRPHTEAEGFLCQKSADSSPDWLRPVSSAAAFIFPERASSSPVKDAQCWVDFC